ncbi:protein kinase [Pendulispora brunnea]|uniref:Protein kinase n=1 Tax=Pendulispora brunnea TaxID=2905690 RepID=A0ABZ2K755_9BACT
MSTVTPVTVGPQPDTQGDTVRDIGVDRPGVGVRILGHLRIEQVLESSDEWSLYLADDEERAELVLVAMATSEIALAACLSGPASGDVIKRTTLQTRQLAIVALNEAHLERFGDRLLPREANTKETLQSASEQAGPRLLDGSTFAGRYRIDGLLGRGGMGEVYRAYDDTFQRAVALKILRVDNAEGTTDHREEAKRRLLHEARVVSSLKHPHIVEIYDAGESDELPYLVLELCDGGNLRKAMAGDAELDDKIRWLKEIAEALAYAHHHAIIHRDIKPENVILTADGRAKVVDFGIAKALKQVGIGNNTLFGLVGTPRYMAPEQLLGGTIDARADQYAWGLVAHELLTKTHPRIGNIAQATTDKGATNIPLVPANIRRVLARAMESRPDARYADFSALLEDMRAPARRRPSWPLLVCTVAALGAMAASLASSRGLIHGGGSEVSPATDAATVFDSEKVDAEMVNRCAPAARSSFAVGLQLWRDASQWEAVPKFEEATKSDPECASARLYYLLAATHTFPKRREHFRHAREQRSRLNERERQMLDALEPSIVDPPNNDELDRRAKALVARMPHDLDARRILTRTLRRLDKLDEALRLIEETSALQRDPIPGNEFEAAMIQFRRRDESAAFDHLDRCLQTSPDSADCLQWKGLYLASKGECKAAEGSLRHAVSVMPQNAYAHFALGNVLLTTTTDSAAARGVFEERWRLLSTDQLEPTPSVATARVSDEYRMALVGGEMAEALRLLRKWNDEVATTNSGRFRGEPLIQLIDLLRDLGQADEARALAMKGLREQRSWSNDDKLDIGIELARLAYLTNAIGADEYRQIRDDWIKSRPRQSTEQWIQAFAGLPDVGADMAPPIAPGQYALDWISMSPEKYARVTMELLRLGRTADAVQHADAAVNCCLAFSPAGHIHAQVAAAKAHDVAGDTATACKWYRTLKARFASAPRSPIFQLAATRVKVLACGKDSQPTAERSN